MIDIILFRNKETGVLVSALPKNAKKENYEKLLFKNCYVEHDSAYKESYQKQQTFEFLMDYWELF